MTILIGVSMLLLGIFIGIVGYWAYARYPDGELVVTEAHDGTKTYTLDLDVDPYYIDAKRAITFKVVHEQEPIPEPSLQPRKAKRPPQQKHSL